MEGGFEREGTVGSCSCPTVAWPGRPMGSGNCCGQGNQRRSFSFNLFEILRGRSFPSFLLREMPGGSFPKLPTTAALKGVACQVGKLWGRVVSVFFLSFYLCVVFPFYLRGGVRREALTDAFSKNVCVILHACLGTCQMQSEG